MKSIEFSFENKSDIKLLIMYVLSQAKSVAKQEYLNKNFFSDFIMESVKISYFDLHDTIFTLAEEGYILMFVKNHKDVLEITEKGLETVGYFFKYIPLSIRDKIDECIYDKILEHKEKESVEVDYWKENEKCYTSTLRIFDDEQKAMQFTISFSDAKHAQKLMKMFKKEPQEFYKKFIDICSDAIDRCSDEE